MKFAIAALLGVASVKATTITINDQKVADIANSWQQNAEKLARTLKDFGEMEQQDLAPYVQQGQKTLEKMAEITQGNGMRQLGKGAAIAQASYKDTYLQMGCSIDAYNKGVAAIQARQAERAKRRAMSKEERDKYWNEKWKKEQPIREQQKANCKDQREAYDKWSQSQENRDKRDWNNPPKEQMDYRMCMWKQEEADWRVCGNAPKFLDSVDRGYPWYLEEKSNALQVCQCKPDIVGITNKREISCYTDEAGDYACGRI